MKMIIERLEQIPSVNAIGADCVTGDKKTLQQGQNIHASSPASQVQLSTSIQFSDIDSSKDINFEHVQYFQNSIKNGSFIIDTYSIAEKLLITPPQQS